MTKTNPQKKIPFHSCSFINASDFFADFPEEKQALYECDNLSFTWGSNNRSLVTIETIINEFDQRDIACSQLFIIWCERCGLQSYVDFEN